VLVLFLFLSLPTGHVRRLGKKKVEGNFLLGPRRKIPKNQKFKIAGNEIRVRKEKKRLKLLSGDFFFSE
jgi:hypothetical protein